MNISSIINGGGSPWPPNGPGGHGEPQSDADLAPLDVAAAITHGLRDARSPRRMMFAEAAVAAALHAERLEVGPYPVAFLARFVRTGGIHAARDLPEPLIGEEPTALARRWMDAVVSADVGPAGDEVFARWLEAVAALLALRRQARPRTPGEASRDA